MNTKIKNILYGFVGGIAALAVVGGIAVAANKIDWNLVNGTASPSITGTPIGELMTTPNLETVVATSTAGSLPTSTTQTLGDNTTSTVPLTYYFEVAASDGSGQTLPSNEISGKPIAGSSTNEMILSWDPVQGASYYYVFYATSSGAEANFVATTTNTTYTVATTTSSTAQFPYSQTTAFMTLLGATSNRFGGAVYGQTIDGLGTASIATGTGAGTTPTVTTTYANGISAIFQLKTGTTPASNTAIVTVAFPFAYPKAPSCDFQAENSTTAAINSTSTPFAISTATSVTLEANVTPLAAATAYQWGVQCQN